ncbi:hypothetical protein Tco_0913187 [Tanacetum coccineum]
MCILIVPQQNTGFILDSDMEGKNEESYKFPIAVQQSFNSLWSHDVHGDPDSGIGGLQIQGETPLEAKKLCDQVKDRMHGGNTLWCRGSYGAKEEDVANFKTKRWNCGACKQLVGEGVDLTGDEDPTDKDGDIGVSVSLGVEIFLEGKKSQVFPGEARE